MIWLCLFYEMLLTIFTTSCIFKMVVIEYIILKSKLLPTLISTISGIGLDDVSMNQGWFIMPIRSIRFVGST